MANSSSLTSRSAALEAMSALRLALEESSQAAREGELTHTHTHTPCSAAEVHADALRDAPLCGEDGSNLLLIGHQRATQPGIAPVHLVQPRPL